MATPDHTPHGRGYMTAMNYFHHDNDYWSMVVGSCPPVGPRPAPTHRLETCDAEAALHFVCLGSSPPSRSTRTATAADCCAECHADEDCAGWAWGLACGMGGSANCTCNMKASVAGRTSGNCTSACKYTGCLDQAPSLPVIDLWHMPLGGAASGGAEGPAHGYNNSCWHSIPDGDTGRGPATPWPAPGVCRPGPRGDKWFGGYEDALFEQQVQAMVAAHDPEDPLFLFWAPHIGALLAIRRHQFLSLCLSRRPLHVQCTPRCRSRSHGTTSLTSWPTPTNRQTTGRPVSTAFPSVQ